MRKLDKLLMVLCGIVLLTFGGSATLFDTTYGQEGCPTDQETFVFEMLPSITDFHIATSRDFTLDGSNLFNDALSEINSILVPLPFNSGGVEPAPATLILNDIEPPSAGDPEPRTFSGFLDIETDSTLSLFVRPNNASENQFGHIKGFIIRDLSAEGDPTLLPQDNWYFIEPLRDLIRGVLGRPGSLCDLDDLNAVFPDLIGPSSMNYHIIYEVRNTDFVIDFDPHNVEGSEHIESNSNTHPSVKFDSNAYKRTMLASLVRSAFQSTRVNIQIDADLWFVRLMGGEKNAKDDIDALMNMLLRGNGTNFYSDFNVQLSLGNLTPNIWRTSGPGASFSAPPNAYEMLCEYVMFTDATPSSTPTIHHLISGHDFANFPAADLGLSDSADSICGAAGCGGQGRAIVGMAAGIGGFRQSSQNSCGIDSQGRPIPFTPEMVSHHSVSQHRSKASLDGTTSKFDATLLQRWVLLAHEIGHNLGARHNDVSGMIKPVMDSAINGTLSYWLTTITRDDTNACLSGQSNLAC